jgi:hypothetical protein
MTRMFALGIGIVFLVVGILGFIPALVVDGELLFGIFAVDAVHNVIHLFVGIFGVAAYYWARWARPYCMVLGVVYLAVGILGFIPALLVDGEMLLGLFHVNAAVNVLHLVVGAAAAYFGFAPQFAGRATPTH